LGKDKNYYVVSINKKTGYDQFQGLRREFKSFRKDLECNTGTQIIVVKELMKENG
jgi:hypothetical protein